MTGLLEPNEKNLNGGYVGLKLGLHSQEMIEIRTEDIKNPIDKEEMHTTIMYDTSNPQIAIPEDWFHHTYYAKTRSVERMGEKGSKWEAIAVLLESSAIVDLHEALKERGMTHSYPDFKPHLSIKYQPEDGDFGRISEIFATPMVLIFKFLYSQSTKD